MPTATASPQLPAPNSQLPLKEARRLCDLIRRQTSELASAIRKLRDGDGWKTLGYATWAACCESEFGYTRQHVGRLLKAERVKGSIQETVSEGEPIGSPAEAAAVPDDAPIPEAQARELARLPEAERAACYRAVVRDCLAEGVRPTARLLRQAVETRLAGGWRGISVEAGLELSPGLACSLQEKGLDTLGELSDWMNRHGTRWWSRVPGVGPAGGELVAAAFAAFWSAHPEYDEVGARCQVGEGDRCQVTGVSEEEGVKESLRPDDARRPCPNCGSLERNEDGDCAECFDPCENADDDPASSSQLPASSSRRPPSDPVWAQIEDDVRAWIGDDPARVPLAAAKLESLAEAIRREGCRSETERNGR